MAIAMLLPTGAQAQNVTYSQLKFGVLAHDVHPLGGKENGIDLNPEIIMPSPIPDLWKDAVPWYLQWMVQPRPALGAEFNSSGYTNQFYFGANWTWEIAHNLVQPNDALTFGIFFGPGFNDGDIVSQSPKRKSLGSNVLFREAFELGYLITPQYEVSLYFDHVSNAGLARYNQSLNDFGARIGFKF